MSPTPRAIIDWALAIFAMSGAVFVAACVIVLICAFSFFLFSNAWERFK